LQQAVEEGYSNREHMTIDTDLDPLRQRGDFKDFWVKLEQRFPTKAVTPERLLTALRDDYLSRHDTYDTLDAAASTVADRQRVQANKPSFEATARRMLDLAEKSPDVSTSLDALAWVLENASLADDRKQIAAMQTRALRLLESDHINKKNFSTACRV